MPDRLGMVLFAIVGAQLLSALAFVILLFAAPGYLHVAVKVFGFFLTLRCGFFVVYGLVSRTFALQTQAITASEQPWRYAGLVLGNLLGALLGVFLILLPMK